MTILELEHKLIPITSKMERNGVKINITLLGRTELRLVSFKNDVLEQVKCFSDENFNINSNEQLGKWLFETLNIKPRNRELSKKGYYKVNKAHLLKLVDDHKVIGLILRYRKVTALLKFCSQLGKTNSKTKRLHANLNQIGTETGRYSSSKPNLQNIPNPKLKDGETDELKIIESQFRKMFVPKRGYEFVCADYSQVELRVMTHYSQDPFLLKAYSENIDLHKLTASEIFEVNFSQVTDEQRSIAKSINFGLIYGKTAYGLSADLTRITGKEYSVEDAQEVIDNYFSKLPKVKQCLEAFIDQADNLGYAQTLYGRRRPISQLQSSKLSVRKSGKRIAMNTPIQGTAADILKLAMIKCDTAITKQNLKSKMVLTVHDELLFEVPKNELKIMKQLVKDNMENAVKLTVPLEVDMETGTNWAMAH